MPDHMKSKGLQEVEQDARFERQELMGIACPWIAIRKRRREAALIRREEDCTDSTQDHSAALASDTE